MPFILGGGRNIVDWLQVKLLESGHQVEKIYLPQVEEPNLLAHQMEAIKALDLSAADLVICIRPQAHLIRHPNKVVWFIHHLRTFYDLWDSEYRLFSASEANLETRASVLLEDNYALQGARKIFTNSLEVSNRLLKFNGIESSVLYPPLLDTAQFVNQGHNGEVVYFARVEHHKRQHLIVEAMKFVQSNVTLRICGVAQSSVYAGQIQQIIDENNLQNRVIFRNEWITEAEKAGIVNNCLAVAYIPVEEDSYGYPTLEGAQASKAILTTSDSGGVTEFVQHNVNGLVAEPTAESIALALDDLFFNTQQTIDFGASARARIEQLGINWDRVLAELLS